MSWLASLMFLFAIVLPGATLPMYRLPVKVQCDTEQAALQAQLSFLPLPEGKKVAFSCRWDDSTPRHLPMRKLLHRHGYRATFYLHETGREAFWSDVFPALCSDGFTVGNHTRSHLELPLLTPNGLHDEILGWSILLEHRSNQPVTAFVLPYGKIHSPYFEQVPQLIGSCIKRAGMLGGPDYSPSRFRGLQMPEGEYFGASLICPGDSNTRPEKFDEDVRKQLSKAETPAHLTLGIHTRHSDEDFQKLEESLVKYAHRPDWWYCNENEYLAYCHLYRHARVIGKRVDGSAVGFTLELPRPELLGSDIPLWAECDGKRFAIPHTRKSPTRIGMTDASGKCAGFPGLNAKLSHPSAGRFQLEVENTGAAMENVLLTLRLSPDFQEPSLYRENADIDGKCLVEWLATPVSSANDGGKRLSACQVDFTRDGVQSRLWVKLLEPAAASPRSAAYQLRYTADAFSDSEQLRLSHGDAELPSKSFVMANHPPHYREGIYPVRLPRPLTANDTLLAVMDFQGGRVFRLRGELPPKMLFNGQAVTPKANALTLDAPAGPCRLLLAYPPAPRPVRQLILLLE
ncbi:MAG: polysaccharide deacetylase family protein [Victivallales bacterium]|nr:polysaccharide deacetylase family protein [Victivallales bacterium]